ncbi:hypothetical protein [Naasia sp. SYSU D00948]|uniref:hypothetical protein n=1 Tax=Naasia sp. SYSU D00948 TaxID=2817379 RepID=UPI001B30B5B3|nr:hypothetical protein [Naasia sp. SYSU D00948]
MSNSAPGEQFLASFNRFESWLRSHLGKTQGYPYQRLLEDLRKADELTKSQELQLQTFGYLRNALAHWSPSAEGLAIADPRSDALEEFRALTELVMAPALVVDVLGHPTIECLDYAGRTGDFLALVRDFDFSQAPVLRDGRFAGVLTVGQVARWLSEKEWPARTDFRRAPLADALKTSIQDPAFICAGRALTAPEAVNAFSVSDGGAAISGIVLLDEGDEEDSVLAMVVPSDLPALVGATSWPR